MTLASKKTAKAMNGANGLPFRLSPHCARVSAFNHSPTGVNRQIAASSTKKASIAAPFNQADRLFSR
ncbi:MAG: hypothetical protein R3F37_07205 [Candidatus Competibacteraceae bacterium]